MELLRVTLLLPRRSGYFSLSLVFNPCIWSRECGGALATHGASKTHALLCLSESMSTIWSVSRARRASRRRSDDNEHDAEVQDSGDRRKGEGGSGGGREGPGG